MRPGRSKLGLGWANYNLTQIAPMGESGKPDPAKAFSPSDRKLITDAIIAACDAKDGLKDGMIFNTRQCQFDPTSLACGGAKNDGCLAAGQVRALVKAFAGPGISRATRA